MRTSGLLTRPFARRPATFRLRSDLEPGDHALERGGLGAELLGAGGELLGAGGVGLGDADETSWIALLDLGGATRTAPGWPGRSWRCSRRSPRPPGRSSPATAPAFSESWAPSATRRVDSLISAVISLAAALDRSASLRTSSATTAKPSPCSPARAASIAAFRASRLVWLAISLMTWMMSLTCSLDFLIRTIASIAWSTDSPPCLASCEVRSASSRAEPAFWLISRIALLRVLDRGRHLLDGRRLVLRRLAQVAGALGDDPRALGELVGRLDDLADDVLQVGRSSWRGPRRAGPCRRRPGRSTSTVRSPCGGGLRHLHEQVDLGLQVALRPLDPGLLLGPLQRRRRPAGRRSAGSRGGAPRAGSSRSAKKSIVPTTAPSSRIGRQTRRLQARPLRRPGAASSPAASPRSATNDQVARLPGLADRAPPPRGTAPRGVTRRNSSADRARRPATNCSDAGPSGRPPSTSRRTSRTPRGSTPSAAATTSRRVCRPGPAPAAAGSTAAVSAASSASRASASSCSVTMSQVEHRAEVVAVLVEDRA